MLQGFLPCSYLLFRSIRLHFSQNVHRVFFPVLAVANTGFCVGPQNKTSHTAHRYTQLVQLPVLRARGIEFINSFENMFYWFSGFVFRNCGYNLSCGLRRRAVWSNDLWNDYQGDRLKFVFSPHIIPRGWLGSKHQVTNFTFTGDPERGRKLAWKRNCCPNISTCRFGTAVLQYVLIRSTFASIMSHKCRPCSWRRIHRILNTKWQRSRPYFLDFQPSIKIKIWTINCSGKKNPAVSPLKKKSFLSIWPSCCCARGPV